jgi:hypothetical protein
MTCNSADCRFYKSPHPLLHFLKEQYEKEGKVRNSAWHWLKKSQHQARKKAIAYGNFRDGFDCTALGNIFLTLDRTEKEISTLRKIYLAGKNRNKF